MKRIALLAAVAALAGCSGSHERTLGGPGITLSLPHGWYGVSGPGQLQAADFQLARSVLASAERARVRRGHVHLIVWDYGPEVPHIAQNPSLRGRLVFRRSDIGGPLEGFPDDHEYATRSVTDSGEVLQVMADLGPKPLPPGQLQAVNRVLQTLRVPASKVFHPRAGVLAYDGVSLRLQPGWSGRIEIPPAKFATRFVLRAHSGDTRLTLLELPRSFRGQRLELPVTVKQLSKGFARRVFSTRGRSFDISAVYASPAGLEQVNQLLAGLRLARR